MRSSSERTSVVLRRESSSPQQQRSSCCAPSSFPAPAGAACPEPERRSGRWYAEGGAAQVEIRRNAPRPVRPWSRRLERTLEPPRWRWRLARVAPSTTRCVRANLLTVQAGARWSRPARAARYYGIPDRPHDPVVSRRSRGAHVSHDRDNHQHGPLTDAAGRNSSPDNRNPTGLLAGSSGGSWSETAGRTRRPSLLSHFGPMTACSRSATAPGARSSDSPHMVPDGFVAGVDHSVPMHEVAKQRCARFIEDGRVELRLGDSGALPYPDASFRQSAHRSHPLLLAEPALHLREVHRVLRDNGVCVVGFRPKDDRQTANFPASVYTFTRAMMFGSYSSRSSSQTLPFVNPLRASFSRAASSGRRALPSLGAEHIDQRVSTWTAPDRWTKAATSA